MDSEIQAWLYDILNAIIEIESFVPDSNIDIDLYRQDIKTKRAVERGLEIIGEAMNRVLRKDDSIILSNARKIVETRNRIIHGYDSVSDETILGIVIYHIPVLKQEVSAILGE